VGVPNDRLDRALNVLSRALEANSLNAQLWEPYLRLFVHRMGFAQSRDLFEQALKYAPSLAIWTQFISHSPLTTRAELCDRLLTALCSGTLVPDLDDDMCALRFLLFACRIDLHRGCVGGALQRLRASTSCHAPVVLRPCSCSAPSIPASIRTSIPPKHFALLWLCLASVMAFRQLPATLHGLDDALSMDLASTALPVLPWDTLAPSANAAAAAAVLREALSVCTAGKAALFQNLAALVQAFPAVASVADVLALGVGLCRLPHTPIDDVAPLAASVTLLHESSGNSAAAGALYAELLAARPHACELHYARARLQLGLADLSGAMGTLCAMAELIFSPQQRVVGGDASQGGDGDDPARIARCLLLFRCGLGLPSNESVIISGDSDASRDPFAWLACALFVELTGDGDDPGAAGAVFEAALVRLVSIPDAMRIWHEHLHAVRSRVLQRACGAGVLEALAWRCLAWVPPSSDARFFNSVRLPNHLIFYYFHTLGFLLLSHFSVCFFNLGTSAFASPRAPWWCRAV
jgi:hypothetical protein